jgi:hypothetical protein
MKSLRNGHAPGHVRDAALDAFMGWLRWNGKSPEPTVQYEIGYVPRRISITRALGLVWNCSDIMPGGVFDQLEGELRDFGEAPQNLRGMRSRGAALDGFDILTVTTSAACLKRLAAHLWPEAMLRALPRYANLILGKTGDDRLAIVRRCIRSGSTWTIPACPASRREGDSWRSRTRRQSGSGDSGKQKALHAEGCYYSLY